MLHHETVQRNLTHIPARFSAVQEVCVGLDEVSFEKKSQKISLELHLYLFSRPDGRFDADRPVRDHPLDGIVGHGKRGAEPPSSPVKPGKG